MDYKNIGLIAGIEIHQQLEGKKLFCDCPTLIREDKPDFVIERQLKAVVGETGKIDAAAAHESLKQKIFRYEGYCDTTCLVEIDEEPPHSINKGAVELAIQMCQFLKAKIVDEVQVMRKTVVDGSNTSGFQRTALIGMNGSLKLKEKIISIPTICIEEDAAKIVERTGSIDIYNLSRLGIPLIEIATGPDLETPEEVQLAAKEIGMLLRSLSAIEGESIKRGLGTIRQDVNVSVKGGARIEIKGAQDLKGIPLLVENEANRQIVLLNIKEKIKHVRFNANILDLTKVFSKTNCKFIKKNIDEKGIVFGIRVPEFKGILGTETMPGRRVGSEISDYAKQGGVGGIIHSDEDLNKYKFSAFEIEEVRGQLGCEEKDAFILIADKRNKVESAFELVITRLELLKVGIPKEVRKANEDCTSSFMRPMPGGSRMYPETDVIPIIPSNTKYKLKTLQEKAKELMELGVKDKDIAAAGAEFFEAIQEIAKKTNLEINYVASVITSSDVGIDNVNLFCVAVSEGKITRNSYNEIFLEVKNGKNIKEAIEERKIISKEEIRDIVERVIKGEENKNMGYLMGKIMTAAKGKADGKIVQEILKEKLK
jgi:glutamyl-tRNA(Gln) amidotransferase subunit E